MGSPCLLWVAPLPRQVGLGNTRKLAKHEVGRVHKECSSMVSAWAPALTALQEGLGIGSIRWNKAKLLWFRVAITAMQSKPGHLSASAARVLGLYEKHGVAGVFTREKNLVLGARNRAIWPIPSVVCWSRLCSVLPCSSLKPWLNAFSDRELITYTGIMCPSRQLVIIHSFKKSTSIILGLRRLK